MKKVTGVILGAGAGKRMKSADKLKQFMKLDGIPVLLYTLKTFCKCAQIDDVVVVVPQDDVESTSKSVEPYREWKEVKVIAGGNTRQQSSFNAVTYLRDKGETEIVVIHDAVRPFVTPDLIRRSVDAAREHGAADVAAKTVDTIVEVSDGFIQAMPDRRDLYNGQTPQTFKLDLIYQAHQQAIDDNFSETTDDIRLVLRMGKPVRLVESTLENMKITTAIDMELSAVLAGKRKCKVTR
jgi:2-C-methyl-D-erythritol 4-phosphate cytidylyltransferase